MKIKLLQLILALLPLSLYAQTEPSSDFGGGVCFKKEGPKGTVEFNIVDSLGEHIGLHVYIVPTFMGTYNVVSASEREDELILMDIYSMSDEEDKMHNVRAKGIGTAFINMDDSSSGRYCIRVHAGLLRRTIYVGYCVVDDDTEDDLVY